MRQGELVSATRVDVRSKWVLEGGRLTIEPSGFAGVPKVLNDFNVCEHGDADKLGNKKFLLKKSPRSAVYAVYIVTVQRGRRKLVIKAMWKIDRSGASC